MTETFSGKISISYPNNIYTFYRNNQPFGTIDFYLEHNQLSIKWLHIKENNEQRKGYGSRMLKMFIDLIIKNKKRKGKGKCTMSTIDTIVLIPNKYDGNNRNWLCDFYEKNGFIQESKGYPFYIMKL